MKMSTRHCYMFQVLRAIVLLSFLGAFKASNAEVERPLILLHPRPTDVLVRYGNESVKLMCLAISFGENVIFSWERANSSIPSKAVGQDSNILTIPQIRIADGGHYRCLATNHYGVAVSHFAYVNVSEFLQARVEPHTQTVEVTTSTSFSCTANGFAVEDVSYAWEITEPEGIPSRLSAAMSTTLIVHNVTKPSMYRCIVTSITGSIASSTFAVLSVTAHPPSITTHPASRRFQLGNSDMMVNVSFTCAGRGISTHYQWERHQNVLPATSEGINSNVLTIYNIQPQDSGDYRCVIRNNSGSAYSNYATLTVTVAPPVITEMSSDQPLYYYGEVATLTCRGQGYGSLQYKWQQQVGNTSITMTSTNIGTLVIPDLSPANGGNYQCIVDDNWNGSSYSNYLQLNVLGRPWAVYAAPTSRLAERNSNLNFTCKINDSSINVTFSWSRSDGQPLSTRVHGSNSDTLAITNVQEEDEGEYVCSASSEHQTMTANITLTVYSIPAIQPLRSEYTVEVSSTLWMTCAAQNDEDARHPLEITWYKGNTLVTNGMDGGRYQISFIHALSNVIISNLMVSNVMKSDGGHYSCCIEPGNIQTNTTVTIHYEPEITTFEVHPSTSLTPGDSIQIVCSIDANPIPTITMYMNNRALFTTEARSSVNYQLSSVTLEDDGTTLSCGAENSVGSVMRRITLSVTGPPATTSTIPTVKPTPSMTATSATSSVVFTSSSVVPITSSPPVATSTPAPADVRQTARGLTSVQVKWSSERDSDALFHVRLSCLPSCSQDAVRNFTTMDKSLTIYGLQPNQIYTLQVADVTNNDIAGIYSDPIQVSTATSASASVNEVVVAERRFKEATVQWRIDEGLTKDLLYYEIHHNRQNIANVNTSNAQLPVPAGKYTITITAVYRLNGSESTWRSQPVSIEIQQFASTKENSVLFQLRLISEIDCTKWQAKLRSITTGIVTDIATICGCPLTTADVFSNAVTCDANNMVYRAGIGATSELSVDNIVTIMNNWIEQSSALVIIDGDTLEIDTDTSCPFLISSLTEPVCGSMSGSTSQTSAPLLAGIIVGVCVVLVVTTILIVIVVFKCRGKTDKIRPGGDSPVNSAITMTQLRSTRRKAQTDEENTYSEVFSVAPPCPIQRCPAYQSSIDFTDLVNDPSNISNRHFSSPASVQVYSRRPSSPGHTGTIHPESSQLHTELELSISSTSSGPGPSSISNSNDYSEPMALGPRLYSKSSQISHLEKIRTEPASSSCSDYLEPVSRSYRSDSKTSWLDCKTSRSDSTSSHNLHVVRKTTDQQVPSDYIDPVSIRDQILSENELTRHGVKQPQYFSEIHDYSEIPSNRNSVSNDYVCNPVHPNSSD